MNGPFVIKAVSEIHQGKAAEYKSLVQEICHLVEEGEPRVLGFNIWVNEDETSEVVVQIHPDAESLEYHFQLLGEKVRSTFEYTTFLTLEVYGPPSERIRRLFESESKDVDVTFHPVHWAGFTRLAPAANKTR